MSIRNMRLATVLLLAMLPIPDELGADDDVFVPAAVGRWTGSARIVVAWTKQTNLCVTLDIREDGRVTGKVGEALLTGRFRKNRGWLGRNLEVKTDYIVVGHLQGSIVVAEGITRSRVKMPLNLTAGVLTGGLHTSGCKFGGSNRMILSAAGLQLTPAAAVGIGDSNSQ